MPILSTRRLQVDRLLQSERSSALYPEHYASEASGHHSKRAIRRLEPGLAVSRLLAPKCGRSPERPLIRSVRWVLDLVQGQPGCEFT